MNCKHLKEAVQLVERERQLNLLLAGKPKAGQFLVIDSPEEQPNNPFDSFFPLSQPAMHAAWVFLCEEAEEELEKLHARAAEIGLDLRAD